MTNPRHNHPAGSFVARALLLAGSLVLPRAIAGQTAAAHADSGRLHVGLVTTTVRFDGRLEGPVWATVDSIVDFRQREPGEGAPASERTVVRVVRDAAALYIGVRAYDDDPRDLRASELRRDADLSSDDNVELLLDSFHDRRGAFVFGTNPNGVMWDAQLVDVDNLNEDWNGVWQVAVTRDDSGWTAVFRIPFQTLRFRGGLDLRFGFNIRRFIRRRNEQDLWRSWGRAEGLYQLLNEGELTDLGAVDRPRDVELYPYVLTRVIEPEHDSTGALLGNGSLGGKAGLDAKLAVSPTLTADLTMGTDFAQVEADQQVINLTRFPCSSRRSGNSSSSRAACSTSARRDACRCSIPAASGSTPPAGWSPSWRAVGCTGARAPGVLACSTRARGVATGPTMRCSGCSTICWRVPTSV